MLQEQAIKVASLQNDVVKLPIRITVRPKIYWCNVGCRKKERPFEISSQLPHFKQYINKIEYAKGSF